MKYVCKYKSHKIALFNSMKKSNLAPISLKSQKVPTRQMDEKVPGFCLQASAFACIRCLASHSRALPTPRSEWPQGEGGITAEQFQGDFILQFDLQSILRDNILLLRDNQRTKKKKERTSSFHIPGVQ